MRTTAALADSVIYATARKFDATLWTQDKDFAGLDAVRYFAKRKLFNTANEVGARWAMRNPVWVAGWCSTRWTS